MPSFFEEKIPLANDEELSSTSSIHDVSDDDEEYQLGLDVLDQEDVSALPELSSWQMLVLTFPNFGSVPHPAQNIYPY